jgi:predicted TIM-barrel enzyme
MENPEDVAYVLERTNAQGFVGASSIERLPIETAIVSAIKAFKQIPLDTRK